MRRLLIAFCLLAVSACSSGGGGSSTPTTPLGVWPRFRRDGANSGTALGILGGNTLSVQWTYPPMDSPPLKGAIIATPAIAENSTIYVATDQGEFVALNPDGSLRWNMAEALAGTVCQPGSIRSSPAVTAVAPVDNGTGTIIDDNRILYFGSDEGFLYAVQDLDDGPVCLWRFRVPEMPPSSIVSSPAVVIDVIEQVVAGIYFATTGGYVYALNRDATLQWQYPAAGQPGLGAITASLALDPGGPLYFPTADGRFYFLNFDGRLRQFVDTRGLIPLDAPFPASPALASSIFIGTGDGRLVALNRDASERWTFALPDNEPLVASPALGSRVVPVATPTPSGTAPSPLRGTIYIVGREGTVYAIDDTSGQPATDFLIAASAAPTTSSPALSADGCIAFGDDAGNLNVRRLRGIPTGDITPTPTPVDQCADATISLVAEGEAPFAIRSSPVIGTDNVLYIGGDNGRLYAIGGE